VTRVGPILSKRSRLENYFDQHREQRESLSLLDERRGDAWFFEISTKRGNHAAWCRPGREGMRCMCLCTFGGGESRSNDRPSVAARCRGNCSSAAFESARLRIIPRVARYAVCCDAADTSYVLKNAQFRVHPEVVIFLAP